jgi:cyclic pyranopterin phosphate synthase
MRRVNDDELGELLDFGAQVGAEVRFIEYMDVGGATQWSMAHVVSKVEMLETLASHYGPVVPLPESSSAPARRYRLADGTVFGIIASTTEPFCRDCDRSRLTADGMWYLCLYATTGVDLRKRLREEWSASAIGDLIRETWAHRDDRGAEVRVESGSRSPLIPLERLKRDPHLEMHTRGG